MKSPTALTTLALLLVGCASAPPLQVTYAPPVDESKLAKQGAAAADAAPATPPPEIKFDTPMDTVDPQDASAATPQDMVNQKTAAMTVGPTLRSFDGGPVVYPFVDGRMYQIFTAPGQQTHITLEPGEQVLGQPVTGDNNSFIMTNILGKDKGQPVTNLFVMAKTPGKTTNVTILTDKRTYTFVLSSYAHTYMPIVKFSYSYDTMMQGFDANGVPTADGSASPAGQAIYVYTRIENMDFNYAIVPRTINKPAWAPTVVFSDGHSVYLQYASARGAAYAPVLFAMDANNKPKIMNYRVRGLFYICDEAANIDHFQLILDKNDGNIIDIFKRHA